MGATLSAPITSKMLRRHGDSGFRVASAEMQGWRMTMEDEIDLVSLGPPHSETLLLGVYDGHSGKAASAFLKEHLVTRVAALPKHDAKSLTRTVVDLDNEFLQRPQERECGSTCVFVLARPLGLKESGSSTVLNGLSQEGSPVPDTPTIGEATASQRWQLTIVNVGDSRATLVRASGLCVPLTTDHKPNMAKERDRILAAGGHTSLDRVDGQLAVSRAMGDWNLKNDRTRGDAKQKVIAYPDITFAVAYPGDRLLVSCDGITEQMTNQMVSTLIHEDLIKQAESGALDPCLTLSKLFDFSLMRGSKDNHSALLGLFGTDGTEYTGSEFKLGPYMPFAQSSAKFKDAYLQDAMRHGLTEQEVTEATKGFGEPPVWMNPQATMQALRSNGVEEQKMNGLDQLQIENPYLRAALSERIKVLAAPPTMADAEASERLIVERTATVVTNDEPKARTKQSRPCCTVM